MYDHRIYGCDPLERSERSGSRPVKESVTSQEWFRFLTGTYQSFAGVRTSTESAVAKRISLSWSSRLRDAVRTDHGRRRTPRRGHREHERHLARDAADRAGRLRRARAGGPRRDGSHRVERAEGQRRLRRRRRDGRARRDAGRHHDGRRRRGVRPWTGRRRPGDGRRAGTAGGRRGRLLRPGRRPRGGDVYPGGCAAAPEPRGALPGVSSRTRTSSPASPRRCVRCSRRS